MKDLRSPAAKAKSIRDGKLRDKQENAQKRQNNLALEKAARRAWPVPPNWLPIVSLPFKAYSISMTRVAEHFLVTDGKSVTIASVRKRFGRPMRVVKEPELAITDKGIGYVGGEYAEIDAPKWWFEWEFRDELEHDVPGYEGDRYQPELAFIPTRWLPLPPGGGEA